MLQDIKFSTIAARIYSKNLIDFCAISAFLKFSRSLCFQLLAKKSPFPTNHFSFSFNGLFCSTSRLSKLTIQQYRWGFQSFPFLLGLVSPSFQYTTWNLNFTPFLQSKKMQWINFRILQYRLQCASCNQTMRFLVMAGSTSKRSFIKLNLSAQRIDFAICNVSQN